MIKTKPRILLVDDDKDLVEMVLMILKKKVKGTIAAAYDGRECLSMLSEEPYDIVILDIIMPGMDGIETLQQIKQQYPLIEVIMLTGHGSIETAVQGMKLGAFDYLLKPSGIDELVAKIVQAKQRKDEQEQRIQKAEAALLLRESRKRGRSPLT